MRSTSLYKALEGAEHWAQLLYLAEENAESLGINGTAIQPS